jgi:hypothetical protein
MQSAEAISEEHRPVAKFGAAPNLTAAEERAVKCFEALQEAESEFVEGREFGQAVLNLHDEIKASGGRNFIARLKQLGITYEKARYWMSVVEGRPTHRGNAGAAKERTLDWGEATVRFKKLKDDIYMLKQSQPGGSKDIIGPLHSLAEILGYQLVPKGGTNA